MAAKEDFSRSMTKFVMGGRNMSETMGGKGRKRVQQHFSFEAFTEKLNGIINELLECNTANDTKKND